MPAQAIKAESDQDTSHTTKDEHVSPNSPWKVKPGWFSDGVPDLKYVPKDAQDLRYHLCNIKNYHGTLAQLLRKAEKEESGEACYKWAKKMHQCSTVRIHWMVEEQKRAMEERSALDTAGASRSSISGAEKMVQKWEKKLLKAYKEVENSKELKIVKQFGEQRRSQ